MKKVNIKAFLSGPVNERFIVLLAYAVLISAVYAQIVFLGKTLLPNLYYPAPFSQVEYHGRLPSNTFNIDLATPAFYEMPTNKLVGDMYLKGHLPLWNPYQAGGTPLAAQYSTRAFFPYQILEDVSPYWLWDYFMLARLIIAAFFTYLFLRLLGISSPCSFLGGIFYGLCGSFTWFINLEQFANVAMMVPICLFSLERLIQYKKWRYVAECAIVLALMLLAGQPEIAIYVMLLIGFYYLFRVVIEKRENLAFLKALLMSGGIVILGLGLCAFLILPFLEFMPISYQCHPLGGAMGIQDPAPLHVAIGMLIPSFFELPTHYRVFPHNGVWDSLGGYTGVLMLFLIMLGFFSTSKNRKFFLFFSLFGLFIVLKNFGFPLAAWIGGLPLLDQSWSPRWAGPVWTFSLACAAAIGLEMASQISHKKKVLFGILSFLLLTVGFYSYETTYFSQFRGLNIDQLKAVLPPIFGGIAVSVCIIFMAAFLFLYCKKNKKSLIYGIVFLAIFELWFYIPRGAAFPWTVFKLIPFLLCISVIYSLAREKWRLSIVGIILIVLSFTFIDIKSPFGFPDRYNLFSEPGYVTFLKKDESFSRVVAGDGILMPNFSSSFKIYDIRYINSLSPAHYQNYVDNHLMETPHAWITDRLWFTGIPDFHKAKIRSIYEEMNDSLLYYSYLGVKYILAPQDIILNAPLVYEDGVKVYENPHAFPRVYVAHNIKMASDFQEAQELMKSGGVDLSNTAILEEQPPTWYSPSYVSAGSQAEIEEYTPNLVKIKANLVSDGILVLTDIFYPGWKAYVDNSDSKIYRINGLVRGLFLKKGEHDIIFKYEPFSFRIGLLISIISLLLIGTATVFKRIKRCTGYLRKLLCRKEQN